MGTGIRVQAVCPGFVDTDFHENNGMYVDKTRKGMFGFRQPGEVVDEAMKEFEKGSIVCVPVSYTHLYGAEMGPLPLSAAGCRMAGMNYRRIIIWAEMD